MTGHYLVTGAAGFIGSRVAELLLESGATVTGIDNMNDAYDVRLKQWRLARLQDQDRFEFSNVDLTDAARLRELFGRQFDAVLNLGARAGVPQSVEDPVTYFETNVMGTLNLLELCKERGVRKLVQASTSSVYGDSDRQPFSEDSDSSQPISPYAASKKAAEVLCHSYHHLHGTSITVLRFFTVYGPAGRPDMSMFRFVRWISERTPVAIYGDGSESRDFTYVDDIGRGVIAAIDLPGFEIVNLGSDGPVQVIDVVRMIEGLTGEPAQIVNEPRRPADIVATWADISKARRLLGWSPQTSIEEGVGKLVEWYQANRDWASKVSV